MNEEIILPILIVYLSILIIIGIISSKKAKTNKGFFLADRSLKTFSLTATITATVVGGSATIATAKLIYLYGLPSLWLDIGAALGLLILGITIAKIVRKTGLYTLPEITGHLFDQKTRYAAAILVVITQIAWISLLIQGTGAIISILIPIEYAYLLSIITLIFILYTILGGQYAVVYTDIIQFLVMIVGVCLIAAPLLFIKAGPLIGSILPDQLSFPINNNYGFLPIVSLFFLMLMPHIVGPDIYSKILSAKNEKIARNGVLLSSLFRMIFALSIGLIAISAIILVPGLNESKAVLAMPMAISQLDPLLAGTILASFVSVMLSSADSVLISSATIISVDITKKKNLLLSRISIIIIGLLALTLALYLKDIIDTLKLAYTIFTSGLTLPILFGFFKNKTKVTSTGAFSSLIIGGITSIIWILLNNPYKIDAIIIGLIFSLIPLLIFREKENEKNIKSTS